MLYITAVRIGPGGAHDHITHCKWLNAATGKTDSSTRGVMVTWLRQETNKAQVGGDPGPAYVGVVETDPPHLRSYADDTWTNDLLALPRY